jgi:hypothetical protein
LHAGPPKVNRKCVQQLLKRALAHVRCPYRRLNCETMLDSSNAGENAAFDLDWGWSMALARSGRPGHSPVFGLAEWRYAAICLVNSVNCPIRMAGGLELNQRLPQNAPHVADVDFPKEFATVSNGSRYTSARPMVGEAGRRRQIGGRLDRSVCR